MRNSTGKYIFLWVGTVLRITLIVILTPFALRVIQLLGAGWKNLALLITVVSTKEGLPIVVITGIIILQLTAIPFLVLGVATRLWASILGLLFIAMSAFNYTGSFFLNGQAAYPQGQASYFITSTGICIAAALAGSGRFSLDRFWYKRRRLQGKVAAMLEARRAKSYKILYK